MTSLFCGYHGDSNCNTAARFFNEDISAWDTSGATSMYWMFYDAWAFNQPIGNWSVGAVTHLEYMFGGASAFNNPIGAWRVDKVTSMHRMFHGASQFDQPLNDWQVDSVKDMERMFEEASKFNQDLGDWRVDQVTSMRSMFQYAHKFDRDLGWCVDRGVDMDSAFKSTRCESTSCGVTHGICWGRGKNRRGVSLLLLIVICLILAICVPLAVSFCFLAGTFGSCSKHKKTQSKTQLPEDPSSDKV
jgi:hypothetical protein